jgi:hypothetical protein
LIGRAVAAVSTGAITPSTRQWAGTPAAASTHAGDSVTLRTGTPIADAGIVAPSRSGVHSAAVMAGLDAGGIGFVAGAAVRCATVTAEAAVRPIRNALRIRMSEVYARFGAPLSYSPD